MRIIYGGYRLHMGYKVVKTLKDGEVVAYGFPARTSLDTQPLGVGVFSRFKKHFNNLI